MKKLVGVLVMSVALVACSSGGDNSSGSSSGSTGSAPSGSSSASSSSGGSTTGSESGSTGGSTTGTPLPQPPSIDQFTADPSSLPAGGGDVTLNWSVNGAETLDLEPGSVNVTGLQGWTVTDVTANTTFRLIATNSAGTTVASTNVNVAAPSDLTGTVVDSTGLPLPYQHVMVVGHTPVLSGLDGTFTVPGVISPYTLVVSSDDGSFTEIFDQVSDANPVVYLEADGPGIESTNYQVGGALNGYNPDAGITAHVASVADEESVTFGAGDGSWSSNLSAPAVDGGSPGLALAAQVFILEDGGTQWAQAGATAFTFPADGSPVDAGITLVPTTTVDVPVSVTAVNPDAESMIEVGYGTAGLEPIVLEQVPVDPTVSSYDLSLPSLPSLSPVVVATTQFQSESGSFGCHSLAFRMGPAGSAGYAIEMPGAPIFSSPIPGSTGVAQTNVAFSWAPTSGPNTVYVLGLFAGESNNPGTQHSFVIFTSSNTFTMPDLSALGLQLDMNTDYEMETFSLSPVGSPFTFFSGLTSFPPAAQDGLRFGTCDSDFWVGQPDFGQLGLTAKHPRRF